MKYPASDKPPVTVDGTEILNISVDWRDGHRDKVKVVHFPVTATQSDSNEIDLTKQPREVLVDGRSMSDLLRAFAQFIDADLEVTDDGRATFAFASGRKD